MTAPDEPAAVVGAVLELVQLASGPLERVDLTVAAGALVGVCSEDAASRAALVRALTGGGHRGGVRIDGRVCALRTADDARRAGIHVVGPRPALVAALSVAHNLMLGREPRRFGLVDHARLEAEA